MELHESGKPHYHALIWLPPGMKLPMPDEQGWWPHGSTRIEWARHAGPYLAKYIVKDQGACELPKGVRMYGVFGLKGAQLKEARWWALPQWLRKIYGIGARLGRVKGGGWVDRDTDEWLKSPWEVQFPFCYPVSDTG
jgi:hypothetical protein